MRVIGLDLSLKGTGVCVLSGARLSPQRTTVRIGRESCSGVLASIERLLSISDEIINMLEYDDIVVIEAAALNQKWQAAAIGELHGVVKTQLYTRKNIVPMVEQATKMRREVVGKIESKRTKEKMASGKVESKVNYGLVPGKIAGKYKKATVKDIIELRLSNQGLKFDTQDEMDAYVAARYAWNLLNNIGV